MSYRWHDYTSCKRVLDSGVTSKSRLQRKVGALWLKRETEESSVIAVQYHSTVIAELFADNTSAIYTGGWMTTSTKTKIRNYTGARFYKGGVVTRDKTPIKKIRCMYCTVNKLERTPENIALVSMTIDPNDGKISGAGYRYNESNKNFRARNFISGQCVECYDKDAPGAGHSNNLVDGKYVNTSHYPSTGWRTVGGNPITTPFVEGMLIDSEGYPL